MGESTPFRQCAAVRTVLRLAMATLVAQGRGGQDIHRLNTYQGQVTSASVPAGVGSPSAPLGFGLLIGARVLAEIGGDRNRFADACGRKTHAGASPIIRASGGSRSSPGGG